MELNSVLLEEQLMLLTSEPFLQPQIGVSKGGKEREGQFWCLNEHGTNVSACHFYYVDPPSPRAGEIFPFSGILLNFFLQRLKVLVKYVFHFLGQSYPKIFYAVCGYRER